MGRPFFPVFHYRSISILNFYFPLGIPTSALSGVPTSLVYRKSDAMTSLRSKLPLLSDMGQLEQYTAFQDADWTDDYPFPARCAIRFSNTEFAHLASSTTRKRISRSSFSHGVGAVIFACLYDRFWKTARPYSIDLPSPTKVS